MDHKLQKRLTFALAREIEATYPTLSFEYNDGAMFVTGDDSPDMLIKDINDIVRHMFEGKIKDVNFITPDRAAHENYMAFYVIPETAVIR